MLSPTPIHAPVHSLGGQLRRRTRTVRPGGRSSVRWVRLSPRRSDARADLRTLSEHDPLLGLALIAPIDTVLAALAADAATIRVIR